MSRSSRTNNAHGRSYGPMERSIGIIPGMIRSTYRSGVKICTAIGQSVLPKKVAIPSPKPNSKIAEHKVVKTSIYRPEEEFGPSEMPGAWKQSVENLTAGMDALDMGGSNRSSDRNLDRGFGGDSIGVNGEVEASKHVGGVKTTEKGRATKLTTDNSTARSNAASPSITEKLPRLLLNFHPFKRLPPEIRLKIWRHASRYQRIIALEFVEDPGKDHDGNHCHSGLRLYARSTIPPLLRVNREAYGECKKLYQMRGSYFSPSYLYNPSTDILYFSGTGHCSCALSRAFWRVEDDTPRVAIDISIPLEKCCAPGSLIPQIMRSLHGYMNGPTDDEPNKRRFHCRGLKEVLLVMESRPLAMIPARINPAVCFRPASTIGITKAQATLKEEFEVEIAKIRDEKPSLFGPNAWVGDDKPTFSFVNFARDKAGEDFETLTASRSEVTGLKVHHSSFINDLRQSTACKIIIPHQKYEDEFLMEIGIKGTNEGVEVCRRKIQDMISLHT